MDILQRGQSMVFVKKSTFSLYVFFSKKSQKETFFYILDSKECFLDLKSEVLAEFKKIDILYRGQSMVFVKKSSFLLYAFFREKSEKETFFYILDSKEYFLDLKNKVLAKLKKSTFFKAVSPWFFSKNGPFCYMFFYFQQKKPERNIL